jgi:hypothetical protein
MGPTTTLSNPESSNVIRNHRRAFAALSRTGTWYSAAPGLPSKNSAVSISFQYRHKHRDHCRRLYFCPSFSARQHKPVLPIWIQHVRWNAKPRRPNANAGEVNECTVVLRTRSSRPRARGGCPARGLQPAWIAAWIAALLFRIMRRQAPMITIISGPARSSVFAQSSLKSASLTFGQIRNRAYIRRKSY